MPRADGGWCLDRAIDGGVVLMAERARFELSHLTGGLGTE